MNKIKRKIRLMMMVITCIGALCACGNSTVSKTGTNQSKTNSKNAISVNDIDIEDFPWEVTQEIYNGERVYAFSIMNNSEFTMLGAQIDYCVKSGVTDSQLEIFNDFREKHDSWIDAEDDSHDIILRGFREAYIVPGDGRDMIGLAIGINNSSWYDIPSEEQFALMEPDILTCVLLGDDNFAYEASYDIKNDKWSVNKTRKEYNNWEENVLSNLIPKPECNLLTFSTGYNTSYISVEVYGIDRSYYESYVSLIKEAGFTEAAAEFDEYYYADNAVGNNIIVDLDEEKNSFSISLYDID